MNYAILIFVILIILIGNYLRFFLKLKYNKLLLCLFSLLIIETNLFYFPQNNLGWLFIVFILTTAYSFFTPGGLIAATFSIFLIIIHPELSFSIDYLLTFYLSGIILGQYFSFQHQKTQRNIAWQKQLFRQAKELNILREVSIALQSTLNLDNLLHIILTAITAGYGLGFNRALLFLVSSDGKELEGRCGIGPMSEDEGFTKWEKVVAAKMNLKDFIDQKNKARLWDYHLNRLVQSQKISLNDDYIIGKLFAEEKPMIIRNANKYQGFIQQLSDRFAMTEVALIPLISSGSPVGLIIIDNIVNHRPITDEDLDSITPLANQAAMAITNATLYSETQEMAITDGLTGLYNQRFFQKMLEKYLHTAREKNNSLTLIILDIDFFKNYNDTNGHLAGNKALIKLSNIIKCITREKDMACRFGGEEFAILLPNTPLKTGKQMAEKLRMAVAETNFENQCEQPNGNLTISLGIATYPEHQRKAKKLIGAADNALYKAKSKGRNRVVVYQRKE